MLPALAGSFFCKNHWKTDMTYNDKVVRQFVVMTVIWGIVGMLVGVIIAAQLWLPALNSIFPGSPTAD